MSARARRFALVSGRWDPSIAVVDIDAALDPAYDGTDRAVISRPRVTPDQIEHDGTRVPLVGLPVSLVALPALNRLLVVNHAGATSPVAMVGQPHGHAGAVALFDLTATLGGKASAPEALLPTGTFGPVGCAVAPDGRHVLVAAGEGEGLEDGGRQISVIDVSATVLRHNFDMPHAGSPCPRPSPDEGFGGFPNPAGLAIARGEPDLVLTADGGSSALSVFRLADVLSGGGHPPLARLPLPTGPFGVAVSPDGTQAAIAGRECPRTGVEGNTVSFLDLAALRQGKPPALFHAELGGGDGRPSRPMGVTFAPDSASAYVAGYRTGTVSRLERGRGGTWSEAGRVELTGEDGAPPCPRGVAVTSDGALLLVAGGPRGAAASSVLWLLEARRLVPIARVKGVGNESYFLEVIEI
ncbi:YncE family protein [Ancylobacter sp.]|uniref:YncE family protein n=1 Tax=Ancylobacter sp. TaxID=1872567 RepID=UPI003D0E897D